MSGAFPAGMCGRTYTGGCFVTAGQFSTNCFGCNYLAPIATSAAELQALKDFYSSTSGGSWSNSQSWLIGDPCISSWYGVTCNSAFAIVGLDLTNNNVVGPLPNSIGNLPYLTNLALGGNGITGSIPLSVSSMSSLTYLTLSRNQLSGPVPSIPAGIIYL